MPTSEDNKSNIIEYQGENITLLLDTGKEHYKAIVHPGNIERNIDIRHKLLDYTNSAEKEITIVENNKNDLNDALKNAIINAEKNASEAKLIISGMQEKMAEFEAELFTVKNQNYLLNAELQALKAEIAEKDSDKK